jgi:hypothetical protein
MGINGWMDYGRINFNHQLWEGEGLVVISGIG